MAAVNHHLDALWYLPPNGCAWRALPGNSDHGRRCLSTSTGSPKNGFFKYLQKKLLSGGTAEAVFMDSTHGKVHQHANGPGSPEDQAVGRSRGGLNTKIHLVVDALGRLASPILLTPDNVSDHTAAPELTADLKNTAVVGDNRSAAETGEANGYDSRALRGRLRARGREPCIPARTNVYDPEPCDPMLYRTRHAVENVFQRIKVFRRISCRFEKPNACSSPSSAVL